MSAIIKQDIKTRWLEALKSGKYKHARGRLQRDGKFCCLGVLCEILKEELQLVVTEHRNSGCVRYNGSISTLPEAVVDYLDAGHPRDILLLEHFENLMSLNDRPGVSDFSKQIDYIERML